MILGCDGGLATFGWAIVEPGPCARVQALGVILQPADSTRGKQADRVVRVRAIAAKLAELVREHRCTAVAAESLSFMAKGKTNMVASACLAWGAIAGTAAGAGIPCIEVPPKTWQHAVAGTSSGKVDYAKVTADLVDLVMRSEVAGPQLLYLAKRDRQHPLDAVGVGVYAAIRTQVGR